MKYFPILLSLLLSLASLGTLHAHPVPDVPVRTTFESGKATISVEVDTRCFAEDPESEPYLLKWVVDEMTAEEKTAYSDKASALIDSTIAFFLNPVGRIQPDFSFELTGKQGVALEKRDDPVMVTATASLGVPAGASGYRIEADESGKLSVVFLNTVDGKEVDRVAVLFPGEKSYSLDLTKIEQAGENQEKKKIARKTENP